MCASSIVLVWISVCVHDRICTPDNLRSLRVVDLTKISGVTEIYSPNRLISPAFFIYKCRVNVRRRDRLETGKHIRENNRSS